MEKGDKLSEEDWLLRRVYYQDKRYIKPDGRPTSRAFTPRAIDDGKLSVDVEYLTNYEIAISDISKFRLFKISVQLPNSLGLTCIYDPLITNSAHAYIQGFEDDDESLPAILANKSILVNYP